MSLVPAKGLGRCQAKSNVPGAGGEVRNVCPGMLCVSGRRVVCGKCGLEHTDTPYAKELAAYREPQPKPVVITPIDYPSTVSERLVAAEREIKRHAEMISILSDRLGRLERGGKK